MEDQSDMHNKLEAESNSTSRPIWTPEPVCGQIDAQDASVVLFERSTYGWTDKKITFSMILTFPYGASSGFIMNPMTLDSIETQ
jgi:hypothetical protein